MLALLLATIIIFKTDIRPEAGCHLYIYIYIEDGQTGRLGKLGGIQHYKVMRSE